MSAVSDYETPPSPEALVATGAIIDAAPDLRTLDHGRILIGGAPLSIMRLSETGATTVRSWFRGLPVGDGQTHRRLARRLTLNGMAHLRPPRTTTDQSATGATVSVIIPVKDDEAGLRRTVDHLMMTAERSEARALSITVVDDGSRLPIRAADITPPHGDHNNAISVVRRPRPTGPGLARQYGLDHLDDSLVDDPAHADTGDVVVFIDAGVTIDALSIQALAAHLDDANVVAVAPRIRSDENDTIVGRYDRRRSPLDLGPVQSLVGPGRVIPYVPTACLVVRRTAVAEVGGFDPDLRYGEDVDLVWRLGARGDIRYVPSIEAHHPPRTSIVEMMNQRRSYGSAAAPLALRHGSAVAPAKLSGWSLAVFALAVLGRPVSATLTVVSTGLALRPKIAPLPDVTAEALVLTARGHWYGATSLLSAVARTWAPLVALAYLALPGQRKRLGGLAAAAVARRLLDGPRQPLPAVGDAALGAMDDLSYCAGVWQGAIRARSAAALIPVLSSWPNPGRRRGSAGRRPIRR